MNSRNRFRTALAMTFGAALFVSSMNGKGLAAESWTEGTPMMAARAGAGAAELNGELYVIGGESTSGPRSVTEIYDIKGNIWRVGVALPRGTQSFGIAALDDKIYVAGGLTRKANGKDAISNELWIFDRSLGVWVEGPKLPEQRMGLGLVAVGGKIYAMGGRGGQPSRVFALDPASKSWTTLKSAMPAPRRDAAYVVVGRQVYVIGGAEGNSPTARVDIFNPADGSWRAGPALPAPRQGHVAALVGGKIHVAGGENIDPPRSYADHFVLNGGSWSRAKALPTSRHASVAAGSNGRFFVIGGGGGAGVFTVFTQTDVVEIYSGM